MWVKTPGKNADNGFFLTKITLSGHKTTSGHLNPAAAPGPNPCPGPSVPREPQPRGFSAASAPSAALRCPRRGWGAFPGLPQPSGGSWEGSQDIWWCLRALGRFYLGQQDEPEMSQPCQCRRQQGCGDPQEPGVGAADHRLCQPKLSGASCLCFPFPPSILSTKSPVFIPLKQLFAVQTPIWDPRVSPSSSPRWGVLFYPPLQVLRDRDVAPCPSQLWGS